MWRHIHVAIIIIKDLRCALKVRLLLEWGERLASYMSLDCWSVVYHPPPPPPPPLQLHNPLSGMAAAAQTLLITGIFQEQRTAADHFSVVVAVLYPLRVCPPLSPFGFHFGTDRVLDRFVDDLGPL